MMCEWLKAKDPTMNKARSQNITGKFHPAPKETISVNKFDITDFNHPYYSSAMISTNLCSVKIRKRQKPHKKPTRQERIQQQIELLRSERMIKNP